MFRAKSSQEDLKGEGSENEVYASTRLLTVFQRESVADLKAFFEERRRKIKTGQLRKGNQLGRFKNVLSKIFLAQPVDDFDLQFLSENEKKLLTFIIKKKKFNGWETCDFSAAWVNGLNRDATPKKSEENMKYVIKKALKFLQGYFKAHVYGGLKKHMREKFTQPEGLTALEYGFYGYYFGCLSRKINQSIEKFFAPRNPKPTCSGKAKLISKTVSRLYLSYLKMSPSFLKDLAFYLDSCLMQLAALRIEGNIVYLCNDWDQVLRARGWDSLLAKVKYNFEQNRKMKLFWSLQEVRRAAKEVRAFMLAD